MGTTVRLPLVTLCHPHFYETHSPAPGATPKYSGEFIFEVGSPAHEALKTAALTTLTEQGKQAHAATVHPPWNTGEEINQRRMSKAKDPRPEVEGKLVVTAKDPDFPPKIVAQDGQTPITREQGATIFGGCIVNALIDVYWSNNAQNPGLFCGLLGVQLVNSVGVDPIGGGRADVTFEPVEGAPVALDTWM